MATTKTQKKTPEQAIEQNISVIQKHRIHSDESRSSTQTIVDNVATFLGSPRSLMAHVIFYVVALSLTIGAPTFFDIDRQWAVAILQTVATLDSLFIALFVLINQRRTSAISRRHSDLDLQIGLLNENKVSHVAKALALIGEKMSIDEAVIRDLKEFKTAIHPDEILDRLTEKEKTLPTDLTEDFKQVHQTSKGSEASI